MWHVSIDTYIAIAEEQVTINIYKLFYNNMIVTVQGKGLEVLHMQCIQPECFKRLFPQKDTE